MLTADKVRDAVAFQMAAHGAVGQIRKYSGEPYHVHPNSVAALVAIYGGTIDEIVAALLHDTLEDTRITSELIETCFSVEVMLMVVGLTKVTTEKDGDRATRKAIENAFIAEQSDSVKFIKLCDIADNISDILDAPRDFAVKYLTEKKEQIKYLECGKPELMDHVKELIAHTEVTLEV